MGLPALGAKPGALGDGLSALDAELGGGGRGRIRNGCIDERSRAGLRCGSWGSNPDRLERIREHLRNRRSRAEAHAHARCSAGVGSRQVQRFGCRVESVTAKIANHAHAHALVEDLLQLFGQRDAFDDKLA